MAIVFGQHRPGDARQLVGDGYDHLIAWSTLREPMHPLPEPSRVVFDAKQDGASAVDQHATQIDVSALADAIQSLFASSGVLPGHDAHPCCEVAPSAKGGAVADGGHGCGGDQRPKTGNLTQTPAAHILITNALNRIGD